MKRINLKVVKRHLHKIYDIAYLCDYSAMRQGIWEVNLSLSIINNDFTDVNPAAHGCEITKDDFLQLAEEIRDLAYEEEYNPYLEKRLEKVATLLERQIEKAGY